MWKMPAPSRLCVALALVSATALPACRQKPRGSPRKRAARTGGPAKSTSSETRPAPAKAEAAPGVRSPDPAIEKAISDGEAAAIEALKQYLAAQTEFRRADRYGRGEAVYANPRDGRGFVDLNGLPNGEELGLVDAAMARAASAAGAKNGYYFVDVTSDAAGREYDPFIDHGLSAVPAEYGRTGRCTFVIDVTGTILKKDNGGRPVATHPGVDAEGWEIAGMQGEPRAEGGAQRGDAGQDP